jgi:hypothetical protein
MEARELRAFRKAQKLSQTRAAALWVTTSTSVWRWEHNQRRVPRWLARRLEGEKVALRKIEMQEAEIANLWLQLHRLTPASVERRPLATLKMSGRSAAFRGCARLKAGLLDIPVCTKHGGSRLVPKGTAINALEYDLTLRLAMEAEEDGLCIQLQYNSQALDDSMAKLLENYLHILEQVIRTPAARAGSFQLKLRAEELEEQDEFLKTMYQL